MDHQRNYRRDSAKLVRESAALGEMEESWLVTSGDLSRTPAKSGGISLAPMMLIAGVIVILLVVAPKDGAGVPMNPISYGPSIGNLGAKVMGSLGRGTVALRQEFRTADLSNWMGSSGSFGISANDMGGWVARAGSVYPGRLRLWQPTTLFGDYQMNFGASIESKAMSWAYRAANPKNYYATKLIISDGKRSEIARWIVIDGKPMESVQLPLSVSLVARQDYQVQVRVQGNRFTTWVDNQIIDTWTDTKLSHGGVGFFSDPGERAAVRWVAVNQQDSGGLGGLFHFGFYLPVLPAALPIGIR